LEQRVHSCIESFIWEGGGDLQVLLSCLEVTFGFYELRESGMV
jgi:hypothetical protein